MNKRLFVAIDPPETVRAQLAGICCGLPDARWTPLTQLHLTLCFIGDVDGSAFLDISEALSDCTAAPFALRFKGVGFFPPRGLPRVVWAGVERSEPLQVLQRKIVTRLFQLGVEPDNRRFSPHLTLARLGDTPPAKVGRWLEHNGLFAAEPFTVDRFLLYSSVLGRKGASHTVEQEYLLGG